MGRLGGVVIVNVLNGHLSSLIFVAAVTEEETKEESDGVEDIDETYNGRDAEQKDTGHHHPLSELCIVHDR